MEKLENIIGAHWRVLSTPTLQTIAPPIYFSISPIIYKLLWFIGSKLLFPYQIMTNVSMNSRLKQYCVNARFNVSAFVNMQQSYYYRKLYYLTDYLWVRNLLFITLVITNIFFNLRATLNWINSEWQILLRRRMCGLRFTNVKHSKNGFARIKTTMAISYSYSSSYATKCSY